MASTAMSIPGAGTGGSRGSRQATPSTPSGATTSTGGCPGSGRRSSGPGAGSTSATISSANKSRTAVSTGLRPGRIVRKKTQQVVQWKTRNVQEGIVVVDEAQLSKLIKRDPIDKFYDMDPEPFATGLFASVRRCRSKESGLQLAAKFSSRQRYGADCSAEIHHEIALLSLCSPSPRVIKLHDVFQTDAEIILVMEYAPGGDLQTLIDDNIVPYESDVVSFTRQLVEGLAYLHHRKIAHLDIKPQNLVMMGDFPDCDVKLCDFEISRVILEGTEIREILGTPDYVAPEILHYEPITMAADMWSLGVTVYVLLTGFSPFGGETDQETFCNISRAQLDFPEELFEDVSEEAQDFIRRLLQRDPRLRPSAKECLRHPWLAQRSESTSSRARNCASCSPQSASGQPGVGASAPNLRKYLSKSREALFERVLQRGASVPGQGGIARASPHHQLAGGINSGKARLCESHTSLVSKSRERALLAMSPSLSRSREKLYGLRSLSRSQEVLAMCRALPVPVLRTLSRATTADLSYLPLLRLGHRSISSTSASVASELDTLVESEPPLSGSFSNTVTPVPLDLLSFSAPEASSPALENTPDQLDQKKDAPTARGSSSIDERPDEKDSLVPIPPITNGEIEQSKESPANEENRFSQDVIINALRNGLFQAQESDTVHLLQNGSVFKSVATLVKEEPALIAPVMVAAATINGCQHDSQSDAGLLESISASPLQREKSTLSSNSESSEGTIEGDEDQQGDEEYNECDENDDIENEESEDEPRFTVAQLITAYNLHDEVVTKSSLDFTMAATDRVTKIPPVLSNKSKFPTGPNALRLFIPDIDITNTKPRKIKTRLAGVDSKIIEEENEGQEANNDTMPVPSSIINGHNNSQPPISETLERGKCNLLIKIDELPSKENEIAIEKIDNPSEETGKFLRSESLSSETSGCGKTSNSSGNSSTITTSWEELNPTNAQFGNSKDEPKTSPTIPVRLSTVQRHRRSASSPGSEVKTGTSLSRQSSDKSSSNKSSGRSAPSPSRKPNTNTINNTRDAWNDKLRRKSTPVFK